MIYAIIVTYHTDLAVLARLIAAVGPQVGHILVVDNGSGSVLVDGMEELLASECAATLIKNSSNLGIADALNQGLDFAGRDGADYVLLLDHDSLPAEDMVATLRSVFESKQRQGINVAAVGPSYTDVKGQHASPFVRLDGIRLQRVECADHQTVCVDHLISSGSLISMSALADIGGMESDLFIDYVDTEWCLRAKSKGYQLYGVADAKMSHDLGDGAVSFMGRKLPLHSPLRYYYLLRNGVWLLRQPWVDFRWRLMDIRRLFLIYIVYSLFVGERVNNWKMMSRGLWHGLTGNMGKLEE